MNFLVTISAESLKESHPQSHPKAVFTDGPRRQDPLEVTLPKCSGRARGHRQSSKREMPQPLPVLSHSHRRRNKKCVLVNLSTLG